MDPVQGGVIGGAISTGTATVVSMLQKFSENYPDFYTLINSFAYVAGFVMIMIGIMELREAAGRHGDDGMGKPAANILIGIAMIAMPAMIGSLTETFWGSGNNVGSVFDYCRTSGCKDGISPLKAVFALVSLMGYIAFVRGWLLLRKMPYAGRGQGDDYLYRGMTHLIGGVFAIHIGDTVAVIGKTFGIDFTRVLGSFQ